MINIKIREVKKIEIFRIIGVIMRIKKKIKINLWKKKAMINGKDLIILSKKKKKFGMKSIKKLIIYM